MTQELLHVEYRDESVNVYYIDKDVYSKAHRVDDDTVILHSWGGTYTFDEATGKVTLSDGVKTIPVDDRINRWMITGE